MARKICNHPVFPGLRARLVANNIHVCPTCRIRLYVCEIEEVQAALEHRNGIFESRTKARKADEKDKSERLIHSALVKRWRLAKIDLYKDLCLFEELRDEGANKTGWDPQLVKAFELWEEVKDECCSVPGYACSQEAVKHVENEDEYGNMQSVDYIQEQYLRSDEGDEANGVWQTVRSRARRAQQSSHSTMPDQTTSTAYDTDTAVGVRERGEAIRNIEVPSKIAHGSYWNGRNRFDLLQDIELDLDPESLQALKIRVASKAVDRPQVMDISRKLPTRTALASSPLKRKRSTTSSDKTRKRKNVRVGDKVTVICDADTCHTSGLPPGQSSYQRPHFSYTAADQAGRRGNFLRRSPLYRPRTWALLVDYENVNTSHYKTTWTEYEAISGLQRWADKRDQEAKQTEAGTQLEVCGDAADMQVGVYAPPSVQ